MEMLIGAILVLVFLIVVMAAYLFLGWKWLQSRSAASRAHDAYQQLREAFDGISAHDAELQRVVGELSASNQQVQAESAQLRETYKGLIDRDAEIAHRVVTLDELKKKEGDLQAKNAEAQAAYEKLQREIALVEETLDLQSYGVYKPHFDFATSESYRTRLERARDQQKDLITNERAALCDKPWIVDGSSKEGERMTKQYMKLMLRAFNGECDAAILKVRWNNILPMEERLRKSFEAINKLGMTYSLHITDKYLNLKLDELRLAFEYQEKLNEEKEEQRRIQEQIREEEKAQRERERAEQQAEEEEERYQKALDRAREEMEKAKGAALAPMQDKIEKLEQQLAEAQAQKARAIAQAQLTRSGYVYVISNVGSFGENVFKIGMTRRLEPMDRIRELGDASVPFEFDVHAMIYADDAPALETELQKHFKHRQVNLVNDRKEFFNVTIAEIEEFARKHGVKATITRLAEAKEYRETLALRAQSGTKPTTTAVMQLQAVAPSVN